ncbi:hypothetical protein H7I87_18690 [Mycobacterium timonense]|uniref:Uncharacterized protein n=5 Tax=Mycobacterium TaxID=1763 RepID=A0AAW5SBA6_MYCBC|nr:MULTISPECIES: hypothetical protein [Mycobacterium]MCV6991783.1 hypothetical protein [Mycobacterium bouchedurhonense]MCV6996707.1 hypothetical protein [Mycobacterium timonense]ORA40500.1 hypothetical protein BST19_28120 [Mycobacterium bouchedurhonense]
MRQVDETLAEAQRLLGSSEPPAVTPRPTSSPQPVPPPQWQSGSATAATAVSAEISAQHGTFAALGDQTRTLVAEANTESMDAQRRLGGIRNEWETDKTALSAMPRTPDRDGAIIAAGQRRVLEAANVVQTAAERFDQAAGKVRRATAELPHPLAHVDPKPPPNPADADVRPYACYLGSKDNDPVKICGPTPALHTWYVDNGRFVQIEGDKVTPQAKVEISAGPGEIMETITNPAGKVGEVRVWLSGPPSPQDFEKWTEGGQRDVNFWWQNPDGSIGVDRRWRDGKVIYQGSIPPGPDWGP